MTRIKTEDRFQRTENGWRSVLCFLTTGFYPLLSDPRSSAFIRGPHCLYSRRRRGRELYPYYQAELYFIRKLAPGVRPKVSRGGRPVAARARRSADPHVERLIEAFALARRPRPFTSCTTVPRTHRRHPLGRLPARPRGGPVLRHHCVSSGGPEPPDARRIRSPSAAAPDTDRVGDAPVGSHQRCPSLWPITVASAKLHPPPPFPPGLNPPLKASAQSALRLPDHRRPAARPAQFDHLRFPPARRRHARRRAVRPAVQPRDRRWPSFRPSGRKRSVNAPRR